MVSLNVDTLTDALRKTSLDKGVSFAGKGLKLDTAQDVKDIVKAIESCNTLEYLNLEGNTLGIEAAEAIAKALEKRSEFKRALWKDMFTGRMKTDIPIALKHLGQGLVTSSARLTELDLSDNAFGPIGVKGLVALLKSPCCYTLQELKLNNNGLGISGATMLAAALTDCYELSKKSGKALGLKLCIIGRNRLENEGATALANVFKLLGTLEEIHMTQNGIYHPGISALSDSFKHNKNLRILNLNDNTIGPKGAEALSKAIPYLTNINVINFGDCLLKTSGAKTLAESLHSCTNLQELTLSFNEIRLEGALAVIKSLENKKDLSLLALNGNKFGEDGIDTIKSSLKKFGKSEILDGMDDDEGDSEDEDEDDEVGNDCKSSDEDEEEENDEVVGESCTIEEFLENPTAAGFIGLGENSTNTILTKAKEVKNDEYLENFVRVLMSVSSVYNKCEANTKKTCLKCCSELYKEVFAWGGKMQKMPVLNNTLLIYLGLIKSEDKKFVLKYDVEGCLCVLEAVMKQNGFPEETKRTLEVFIKRDVESEKEFLKIKRSLLGLLKSNV